VPTSLNGLVALRAGRPLRAARPLHLFRHDGPMVDALGLRLTIPPELGPAAPVVSDLRHRVRAVEHERLRSGRRVQGRRGVLAQSWRDQLASYEPRAEPAAPVATRIKWARIEALQCNRAFAVEYASARPGTLASASALR
jgi:hypothetical protein